MNKKTAINLIICSKPLQWFNALNIKYTEGVERILIILGAFTDATDFYEKVKKHDDTWKEVLFVDSRETSYEAARKLAEKYTIEKLYVDCDYGSIGNHYATLPAKELYVIEEGFGPYVHKVKRSPKGILKRIVFNMLGWGTYLGSNRKTKAIYLHNPAYYRIVHPDFKKEVLSFNNDFYTALQFRNELITKIFGDNLDYNNLYNKKVAFYLTAYNINSEIIRHLVERINTFDHIIIKVHPHLKNNFNIENYTQDIPAEKLTVVTNNTLAEVFISRLSKNNDLTIFHESSASCLYVNEKEVKVFNMGSFLNAEFGIFREKYMMKYEHQ